MGVKNKNFKSLVTYKKHRGHLKLRSINFEVVEY